MSAAVVLPALNEEACVATVVEEFLRTGSRVVVVDNGSSDATSARARESGAEVVHEPRRGYGRACLAGMRALEANPPEYVAFADCDGTIDPDDLDRVLHPLRQRAADLVLGRRTHVDAGAMPWHQRSGNVLFALSLRLLHGIRVRDIPPLRAARWDWAQRLQLREPTYGLPIETIVRTHRLGGRILEVDTHCRARRGGTSKVAGSWTQSLRAALHMARIVARLRSRRGST